jgi:hypothetical protein
VFLETAIEMVIQYLGVRNAYPNLTHKGEVMKMALNEAATQKLPEAKERIKRSRSYVAKISTMVRYLYDYLISHLEEY